MNKVLIFYIRENLIAVTAAIRSDQFVTIELPYPFTGINADYNCEEGNFLSQAIPHKIQEFAEQICKAYYHLATRHESFLNYVEHVKNWFIQLKQSKRQLIGF